MGAMADRSRIIVKGIVQGVGFRPFVFNLAESLGLVGYVTNTSAGVIIEVEGTRSPEFLQKLKNEAPPLSRITDIAVTTLPLLGYDNFSIKESSEEAGFTLISPDVSTCKDCLREMLDPADRRHLYPFINCTNCGPRYSITKTVPYDRPNTTMAVFPLCPACSKEYHDPRDRRFHAQPNACPTCGPQVEFKIQDSRFKISLDKSPIQAAIEMLKDGGIVAVKGIGGFHIACDASNDAAVKRLREKKRKSNKPFAVMVLSVEAAQEFCVVSEKEKELFESMRRPIVLLKKKEGNVLSEAVSPNNQFIGVMLPYTPLHYLLFQQPIASKSTPHFKALVMTSGNLSEEPIVHENEDALKKLGFVADGFLLHNRDIFMRVDDSVIRIAPDKTIRGQASCGMQNAELFNSDVASQGNVTQSAIRNPKSEISFIRRSRGFAPDPIALHDDGPEVLGCGADLKTTFTLTKGKFAIPSQHIGDMENYETLQFYEESLANLKTVYRANPTVYVHDLHPGYGTTRWAKEQAEKHCGMPPIKSFEGRLHAECGIKDVKSEICNPKSEIGLFAVQHHYAHIGAVMAEHGLKDKVIGVAFDGTGYGTDANLWGGEFLIAGIEDFERAAQLKYISLPGGEAAIREPWRTGVSFIREAAGEKAWDYLKMNGFVEKYGRETLEKIMLISRSSELSPLACGAGRLFDAVSALLGICEKNTFEGEAAMALEAFTREGIDAEYEVAFNDQNGYSIVNFGPAILQIIEDAARKQPLESIATKFHNTVATVILKMAKSLSARHGIKDVALSGGTFQNLYLLNRATRLLTEEGLRVFTNHQVPCNDACISLGQAYLVRERLKK